LMMLTPFFSLSLSLLMQCRRTRATARRRRRPTLASHRRLRPTDQQATHAMEFTDLRALNSFHFVQRSKILGQILGQVGCSPMGRACGGLLGAVCGLVTRGCNITQRPVLRDLVWYLLVYQVLPPTQPHHTQPQHTRQR
jgi:hypothetical protein